VNAAAVEALFAGAGQRVVDGVVSDQPSTAGGVDAAFAARPPEALSIPAPQVQTAADSLPHLHKGDRADAADVAELADLLTATL
jgi:hypothetical protein